MTSCAGKAYYFDYFIDLVIENSKQGFKNVKAFYS